MAPNLGPGVFKIVSHTKERPPIGGDLTLPAVQFVRVNGVVRQWVFRKEGNGKYRLSNGGYPFTGVMEDKVIISIHHKDDVEWEFSYAKLQDAYTIARADDPSVGWTVVDTQVKIEPIIMMPSEPPQFRPNQLFALEQFEL